MTLLGKLIPMLLTTGFLATSGPALAQDDAPDVALERMVVAFSRMPDGLAQHGRFLGAAILAVDDVLGFAVVQTEEPAAFRSQAEGRADVRFVEADPVRPLVAWTPDDPLYASSQYGPQLIGAPAAWGLVPASQAPTLCIPDTGVRMTHSDLAAHYAGGIDLVNGDNDPSDDNGHGTHVAGIANAVTNNSLGIAGISPGRFLAVKVLDASGSGAMSTVASGIRWCVDNGAKVVSLSLGGTSGTATLQSAVDYAWTQGALVLAAAGNGNGCSNCVQFPAAYPNAIAVGCVDQNRAACSFASTGPEVDLAGPGNAIQSTWWTSDIAYQRAGGTSMSTPHVAGATALVWAAHPEYSNVQVRQALESSAQDVAAAGKDVQTGAGLVRADLAIAAAVAPTPPAPPTPTAGVAVSPASQSKTVALRSTAVYTFTIQNTGSDNDTMALSLSGQKSGWSGMLSGSSVSLAPGASATVQLTVKAPAKAGSLTMTLSAVSSLDPAIKATATATTTAAK